MIVGALAVIAAGAGCGGGDGRIGGATEPPPVTPVTPVTPTPPAVRLVVAGRLERGLPIAVAAFSGTDSVPGAQLRLSVDTAAATAAADGTVTPRRAGALTITATLADGRTATTVQTIAAPPLVALDLIVDGNRDVYTVSLDGGDLTRLTTDLADDVSPSVGAGTVAFTSYRTGGGDIYRMPLAGGTARRLTATADADGSPSLSADGSRLAFIRPVRGVDRVWVADSAGADVQRLTTDVPANNGAPEASPAWGSGGSGAQLAFTSTAGGQVDIDVAATTALPVAPARLPASALGAVDVEAAWSADGARLVFVSTRDGPAALYVADAGASTATRVTAAGVSVSQPTWLADGRIVFVTRRANVAVLVWLDPAAPTVLHDVPLTGQSPAHPAAVR